MLSPPSDYSVDFSCTGSWLLGGSFHSNRKHDMTARQCRTPKIKTKLFCRHTRDLSATKRQHGGINHGSGHIGTMSTCIHSDRATNGSRNSDTPFKAAAPCAHRSSSQHWHQHCTTSFNNVSINGHCIFRWRRRHHNDNAVEAFVGDQKITPTPHYKSLDSGMSTQDL